MKKLAVVLALAAILLSCSRGTNTEKQFRTFPDLEIPAMISSPESKLSYSLKHYWDGFFAGEGISDSTAILGVASADVETAVSSFLYLCSCADKAEAAEAVARLFAKIETAQSADSTSHLYLLMTNLVSKYLYDPNSPMRDEDLYLPFLKGMISSPFTRKEVMPGYVFEEKMCSLNRYGTIAADFEFKDKNGRKYHMHGIKADYTLLFFSNPGCTACRDINLALMGIDNLHYLISTGKLAVINIYIDRELDKWREYEKNYPEDWISGYDHKFIIRDNALYNVRAIPSLYMLDSQKRVLMKDAETNNIVRFITSIQ